MLTKVSSLNLHITVTLMKQREIAVTVVFFQIFCERNDPIVVRSEIFINI